MVQQIGLQEIIKTKFTPGKFAKWAVPHIGGHGAMEMRGKLNQNTVSTQL